MIYSVRARWLSHAAADFYRQLTDGTIVQQHPQGPEILASMRRARVTAPGVVEWTERCHSHPPLEHERRTVYDHHFCDIEATPVHEHDLFPGQPFMQFLAQQV
jgi:hypothetical protein